MNVIMEMVRLKSKALYQHSLEVSYIAESLATTMGLRPEQITTIKNAGTCHDIGKMGIKEDILLKPGSLTEKEWEQVKLHPFFSVRLLQRCNGELPPLLHESILYHHENADGSGYLGLKEIPIGAKILRIADCFSAMTMERPYKPAFPAEVAAKHCSKLFPLKIDVETVLLQCKENFNATQH